ncbi:MAG TPA: hypothetical protein PLU55_01670 [Candidatus Pacearchaeota archaeon]|nr:hypothetical protein [Candidatus Pacearchaeota archaeon]
MNRLFVEVLKSNIQPESFLLQEGFTIDAKSEFSSFGELLPGGITNLVNLAISYSSTGSTVGAGTVYMSNVMDLKRWMKTYPASINCTLKFYTREDVVTDVWLPMNFFLSLGILSRIEEGTGDKKRGSFVTPAPSLGSCGQISRALNGDISTTATPKEKKPLSEFLSSNAKQAGFGLDFSEIKSKILSVLIPGVIYLPYCFVEEVTPTYSNQVVVADNGKEYPLWGEIQLRLSGIYSAIDDMLDDSNKIDIISKDWEKNGLVSSNENAYPTINFESDDATKAKEAQQASHKEEIGETK